MYVAEVPNRNSKPTYLIRESYRENGHVKTRTILNITKWPKSLIMGLKKLFKGEEIHSLDDVFTIKRSLPHGHIAAVLGTLKKCGLYKIITSAINNKVKLILSLIVSRIIYPGSKLKLSRIINENTCASTFGQLLNINNITEKDLYRAMDSLYKNKDLIEKKLAKKHLSGDSLILYDTTSTYFEGKRCPIAKYGYNKDKKKGKLQIVIGLICSEQGCPIAVEVFEGNTKDSDTLQYQINKMREKFNLKRIILVGDRGLITDTKIRNELKYEKNLDWITALKSVQIRELVEKKDVDTSLFDDWGIAEISSKLYPGERLIVCYNPLLKKDRRTERDQLLKKTEQELAKIQEATKREKYKLKGKDKIGVRVGKIINKYKMAKHFIIDIHDNNLNYEQNTDKIEAEKKLDGIYIIRTSLKKEEATADQAVLKYKNLSNVEKAFRCLKTIDLHIRPVYHRLTDRVKAHVFLCMLAYYVQWHMKKKLAPILFEDAEKEVANMTRENAASPAKRSIDALLKDKNKITKTGLPVHSFNSLMKDLSTVTKNWIYKEGDESQLYVIYPKLTEVQKEAFSLLGVSHKM